MAIQIGHTGKVREDMAYFSRLTDIVTCNLTSLLARHDNCSKFLTGIIQEMREGIAGAERCVRTATANVSRLEAEIGEQRQAALEWVARAQESLKQNDEMQARASLERKHEVEDLIAGLEQQLQAAIATRDHLNTMLNALQARLADATRRLAELTANQSGEAECAEAVQAVVPPSCEVRQSRIESELEELRRQISAE